MYYRYKTRKKDRRYVSRIFYLVIAGFILYTGYQYRYQLMFWRISHNRIVAEISAVTNISDPRARISKLKKLKTDMDAYKQENDLNYEAYILAARVCYGLGLSGVENSFSDIYLNDSNVKISQESEKYLIEAIKNLHKAIAIQDGRGIGNEDFFILAGAYYLTGYYSGSEIYALLKEQVRDAGGLSVENARFFAIASIKAGNTEEGLSFLRSSGNVEGNIKGKLLYARALRDGLKNTEAIIAFKKILEETEDPAGRKTAYMNLGKIYHSQQLYRESMEQFLSAQALEDDAQCRIWIGRNYFATGDREKAKSVWTEVLNSDSSNEEVKKLLGMF